MESPEIFTGTGVKLAVSTKADGHMSFSKINDEDTEANINDFVNSLSWQDKSRSFMRITYGDDRTYDAIKVIDSGNKPPGRFSKPQAFDVDTLVTNLPNVILLLPTADCYPITIFDPKHKALALNHIGWHSTAAHLLEKTIKLMENSFGSSPKDLLVHIGPGIPAEYYVFKEPAQLKMPGWKPYLKQTESGWGIDLLGYNLEQLKSSGVATENIEVDPRNTVETEELESNYMHNKQNLPPARRFLTAALMS